MRPSYRAALGGISSALSLLFLVLAVYIPAGQLALYALSSVALLLPLKKGLYKTALLCYAAVSLLALLLTGNILYVVPYWLFFGLHPMVLSLLLKYKVNFILSEIIKLLFFNVVFFAAYQLSALFFLEGLENQLYIVLAAVGTAAFLVYDYLLTNIFQKSDRYMDRIFKT